MMALGAVQAQPPSTVVAVGLLLGAAVALTKWESRGGKTSDKLVYIGGGALLGAAALAFWPKKKTDPTLTGKKSAIGAGPYCNYTVWDGDSLVEVIRIPGTRRSPLEEQALINWVFFKYPTGAHKWLLMAHCHNGAGPDNVELVRW